MTIHKKNNTIIITIIPEKIKFILIIAIENINRFFIFIFKIQIISSFNNCISLQNVPEIIKYYYGF